jgi:putative CocE/NonD family hydrolase
VLIAMRDGVRLSTDLYFPEGAPEPLPVVLIRTPYNKQPYRHAPSDAYYFASHGYVVAVQDHRGKFESEGEFFAYTRADRLDGYDTVTWLAEQEWSNGAVGTYGCSYLGEVQDELAAMRHPNHRCAIPQSGAAYGGGGVWGFGFRRYGALELAPAFSWCRRAGSKVTYQPPPHIDRQGFLESPAADYFCPSADPPEVDIMEHLRMLPVVDLMRVAGAPPNDFEDWLSHPPDDEYWKQQGTVTEADRFDVPALHVNSWYDITPNATLTLFNLYRTNAESERARDHQYLLMSPMNHCRSETATEHTFIGARDVGNASLDYYGLYVRWFDHWLKGEANGVTEMPKVRLFVMGRNEWRDEEEWPLSRAVPTPFFLHSGGRANSRFGDGLLSTDPPADEPLDTFVYDPRTPVPTVGGPICCTGGAVPEGSYDQREVEARHDVLVYSSAPLDTGLEVTGPLEVVLYVSSSARDTDFTAKLVDVYPDGTAYNIQEGILRARYREGLDHCVWLEPEGVYKLRIDLEATSNWFGPGHRIRLEISSSNFPRWDRNLNTGGNNYDESEPVVARNVVHHTLHYPSHILLPVVPEQAP